MTDTINYKVEIDNFSDQVWDNDANKFRDYTIYQTPAYQSVRAAKEKLELSNIIIRDSSNAPVLMCIVRIKCIPILGLRVGYVQWGPLVDYKDSKPSLCNEIWTLLRQSYIPQKVDILRVVPNIVDDEGGRRLIDVMINSGFDRVPNLKRYHTIYVPVSGGGQVIRAGLHHSWRRALKKVECSGLEIREGNGMDLFHELETIYLQAKKRKGFRGLDSKIFLSVQEKLRCEDRNHIIVAYSQGVPVCAHASSYLGQMGEGILAGSSGQGLSLNASYLVWWKSLMAAHRAGMDIYNLGGIDPENNMGVYQFKTRMGGKEVYYIGAFEVASSNFHKKLWRSIERTYRFVRP